MKLQLGFEDTSYSARYSRGSPLTATQKKRRPKVLSLAQQAYGAGKTVGQVAEELEKKYGIVEAFYGMEEDFIVDSFEKAMIDGLAWGMNGGSWDYVLDTSQLEGKFRRAITSRKFDGLRGVPTRAARMGVSHLRADPYRPSAERPSFMDTSLYMRSFRAWTEK
jgi:hypothetical protein